MSNESPFFLTRVECPICTTLNEFETVRVGSYREGERDTDFCPQEVTWRNPRYQAYNPLSFFTATCSNCFYTREFTKKFKEWKNDSTYRTYRLKVVKPKHLEKLAASNSIIRRMGEAIDLHKYPNETGIIKLHLAILDETFNEHVSHLDLGRFYLRVAWIYRSMGSTENPNLSFLRGQLNDIDSRFEDSQNSLAGFKTALKEFGTLVQSLSDSDRISAELKSQIVPASDAIINDLKEMSDRISQCDDSMTSLEEKSKELKSLSMVGEAGGEATFGSHLSFTDFMMDIRNEWSGVVLDENSALEKAVYHYQQAFSNGKDIGAGNQQIQAAYLIGELSRRVGDYDGAKQFFNTTIKLGQEFIYENRREQSKTALARKILELAIEQGRMNLAEAKKAQG